MKILKRLVRVVIDWAYDDGEVIVEGEIPEYGTDGAACFDMKTMESVQLAPLTGVKVSSGLRMRIPRGWCLEIVSRSGWSSRGLIVTNAPAQIDSDYRGVVGLLLFNLGPDVIEISAGSIVCQGKFERLSRLRMRNGKVDPNETSRGEGGFGSTDPVLL